MGTSRFRISHVMPHWWFYKLRDIGGTSNQRPLHLEDKPIAIDIQRTINLPRSDFYKFASSQTFSERVYAPPILTYRVVSDIHIPEAKKKQKEGIRIESKRRINGKSGKSHRSLSTLVEARISAGCSCRTRITSRPHLGSNRKRIVLKKASDVVKTQKLDSNCSRNFPGDFRRKCLQAAEKTNKISSDPYKSRVSYVPKSFNTVEKATLYNVLKREDSGDFEELKEVYEVMEDPASKRGHGRKCSAFCCSCRLSLSSIEADADSLCDVGLSSEDDVSEDSTIQVPFLNKCPDYNSMVLGMKFNLPSPVDDMKESTAATLFRRRDDHGINSHARAQAKLGEMIRAKGCKKLMNHHDHESLMQYPRACTYGMESVDFNQIENVFPKSPELYGKSSNHAESDPKIVLDDYNSCFESFYKSTTQTSAAVDSDTETEIKEVEPRPKPLHGKRNSVSNNRSKIDHGSPRLRRGYRRSTEPKAPVPTDAQRRISESFAIVKCSYDPRRDFRESMLEMILKNEILESKDLQELVRRYVSLNSEEYHPVILEVFDQIQSSLLGINA